MRLLLLFAFPALLLKPGNVAYTVLPAQPVSNFSSHAILSGYIRDHVNQQPVANATLTVRQSTLGCFSDNTGHFRLSLEQVRDTATLLQLFCSAPHYRSAGLLVRGAIRNSVELDMELVKGVGHQTLEYRVDLKSKRALLISAN